MSCHTSSLDDPKGGLMLDRRDTALGGGDSGPAILPGQPDASLLIQAIRGEASPMPPDRALSKAEQEILTRWIAEGAYWPEVDPALAGHAGPATGADWLVQRASTHWAWRAVRDAAPPTVRDTNWPLRPLDTFILAKLEESGLTPAESASASTILRRLAFDLTGLPPDAQLLATLEGAHAHRSRDNQSPSDNQSPIETAGDAVLSEAQRLAELVDSLLASPQFGATWGRHWLDLVRYSETLGHEFDFPIRYAWQYREAVVDSWNSDVSYATFIREHLAGDSVTDPRRHPLSGANQSLALTGWWWFGDALHAPVDVLVDEAGRVENQIDVYSKTFLGMTLACARCHDHKFDALSLRDYTSLVGILQSSRRTYGLDDPSGRLAEHNRRTAATLASLERTAAQQCSSQTREALQAACAEWLQALQAKWGEDREAARAAVPLGHPLYPLRALGETPDADAAARAQKREQLRQELSGASDRFEQWQQASPLLADFRHGLPAGWYVESADSQLAERLQQPSLFDWCGPTSLLPARNHVFSSSRLGTRQELALRSPTFDLPKPLIALRLRGKSVLSVVTVDNYFMNEFQGLLFGDMRKGVDQPHDWGWIVHGGDLRKYVGHPAYLSLEDDANAWFELGEVRVCDAPPPPEPHAIALALVQTSTAIAERKNGDAEDGSQEPPVRDAWTPEHWTDELAAWLAESWLALGTTIDGASSAAAHDHADSVDAPLAPARVELLRAVIMESDRLGIAVPLPRVDAGAARQLADAVPAAARVLAIHEGTPRDARTALRGNPRQLGEPAPRAELEALGGAAVTAAGSSGRRELAESLTDPQHPLAARVIVNRVWTHLLGQGLHASPDNFGLLGGAPTHPELLDYLTARFIEHDWSVKWLVREICTSRTYQLSSVPTAAHREQDPDGRLFSHRRVRRLTAEMLRDALVAVSGSLDRAVTGESVPVHLTDKMTGRGRPGRSGPLDGQGRRSVFIELRRNFLDPFLVAFDQPLPATTVGKRNRSNVPAQALGVLNDPLVHEMSRRWARSVLAVEPDPARRIEQMFVTAYARRPAPEELALLLAWLGDSESGGATRGGAVGTATDAGAGATAAPERWTQLAHVLMCSKEFMFLP
jgi:hypothetical protein